MENINLQSNKLTTNKFEKEKTITMEEVANSVISFDTTTLDVKDWDKYHERKNLKKLISEIDNTDYIEKPKPTMLSYLFDTLNIKEDFLKLMTYKNNIKKNKSEEIKKIIENKFSKLHIKNDLNYISQESSLIRFDNGVQINIYHNITENDNNPILITNFNISFYKE